MSIFNNKNITPSKNPYLSSFNMESSEYKLLSDLENDSFKISLEFNQSIYTGLKYDNIDIVNEGFTDFFKRAAEFFKTLAKKIVEFAKNYMRYFVSYLGDFNKFLEKNKDHLRSLDVNFQYKGYEFDFPKNVPDISKVHDIVSSYNADISNVDNMKFEDVTKMREEFANETRQNKLRASILNNGDQEISQDKFKDRSKAAFRKSNDPSQLNINNSYIDMIITEYGKMKSLLNETEMLKNKILILLNDLEYFFDKKATVTYEKQEKVINTSNLDSSDNKMKYGDSITMKYDTDKLKMLNSYFDLKYRESKFISNCIITVFMDKINTLKDCMQQYRSIIRQALTTKKDNDSSDSKK